jgi:5-methyltetrahydrofolate--homocysteine methyltransferase
VGEDVEVYPVDSDDSRDSPMAKFCMLRQQQEKESDEPYYSLADFVAPRGTWPHHREWRQA